MEKIEQMITVLVIVISTLLKIWSIVTLCAFYMHAEEISQEFYFKFIIKRVNNITHNQLY